MGGFTDSIVKWGGGGGNYTVYWAYGKEFLRNLHDNLVEVMIENGGEGDRIFKQTSSLILKFHNNGSFLKL